MGTHPHAPSLLADNGYAGQPLLALLRDRPELLGAALPAFGADLPFLFKVLSVGTALSIQSHPDKELAEQLHAERPEVRAVVVWHVVVELWRVVVAWPAA
jgi:mannose-6-phosphate isomerase